MEWILENKDWLFSGIGCTVITIIFSVASNIAGFKLTHRFYILMFISIILTVGLDYLFNNNKDWRVMFFIFGITTIILFLLEHCIVNIKAKLYIKQAIKKLSLEDCEYIVKCYEEGNEYVIYKVNQPDPLPVKWNNILYTENSDYVIMNHPYQICVYTYAYRLAKKRIIGE